MSIYTRHDLGEKVLFFVYQGPLVSIASGTVSSIRVFISEQKGKLDASVITYGVKSCGIVVDVSESDVVYEGYTYAQLTLSALEAKAKKLEKSNEENQERQSV